MTEILQAKSLIKKFGGFTAVDNVSFSLHEGEILGFLGPNGAGKTTVIQILLGSLIPSSGDVFYFGKNLKTHREEILEQVNFSSTYTNLPWTLTVRENLSFVSYLYKIEDRRKRVEEIIDIFRLKDLKNQPISHLSAGQVTRVNVAKAFINNPRVLLLDEPTASLDPDVASYIREFILNERKKFKVSIIFTSHNMPEVEDLCDRVIFINQGKVVSDDTPENLAKSLEVCHVELLVPKDMGQLAEYCRNSGLKFEVSGKRAVIDIKEDLIPNFLTQLAARKIEYDEISIQKPSLEDYFLANSVKKLL